MSSNGFSSFQLPALDITTESLTTGTSIPPPPPSPPPGQTSSSPRSPSTPLKTAYSLPHLNTTYGTSAPPAGSHSPDPLRSHPTSSHSLDRKFSGSPPVPGAYPASPAPSPAANKRAQLASPTSPQGPPPKRPMSVRKLLGLKALNSRFGRASNDSSGSGGVNGYQNGQGQKSSDDLSMFSFARPDSAASGRPSLKSKRSSAFWVRRGSSIFGTVEEDGGKGMNGHGQVVHETIIEDKTPPPMLPEIEKLGGGKRLKEGDGGFLGGGDMFRDIK